jgi:hypothetical protein
VRLVDLQRRVELSLIIGRATLATTLHAEISDRDRLRRALLICLASADDSVRVWYRFQLSIIGLKYAQLLFVRSCRFSVSSSHRL